jgi:hypothetical protein
MAGGLRTVSVSRLRHACVQTYYAYVHTHRHAQGMVDIRFGDVS